MPGMRIAFLLLLFFSAPAIASEALWSLLKGGGQVVLIRHAVTTPGSGDPPGMHLDDCSTQRNLSDEGRQHARRIGEEFRKRQIPVERVLSSPWCRCLETARLAFGKAEVARPLDNLFGRHENRDRQIQELRSLMKASRGANWVLVSHGSTIQALTGISPATGEMVIVAPSGALAGRLVP
jgi:broad specificity phosphatase PhoE